MESLSDEACEIKGRLGLKYLPGLLPSPHSHLQPCILLSLTSHRRVPLGLLVHTVVREADASYNKAPVLMSPGGCTGTPRMTLNKRGSGGQVTHPCSICVDVSSAVGGVLGDVPFANGWFVSPVLGGWVEYYTSAVCTADFSLV